MSTLKMDSAGNRYIETNAFRVSFIDYGNGKMKALRVQPYRMHLPGRGTVTKTMPPGAEILLWSGVEPYELIEAISHLMGKVTPKARRR